jgi:hypothetical protein
MGRGGATCLSGNGDGTMSVRRRAAVAWALRAGVVARARLTTVANLECLAGALPVFLAFELFLVFERLEV